MFDYRHVKTFIYDFKSRLEDISVARDMFDKNDCLFGFDLKSAYYFIEIYKDHRELLGFQWKHKGKDKYFVFNFLPFGVSVAAYIFTKVTRVLINKWRNQGIRIGMYLDDGLGGDVGYEKTSNVRDIFKQDLHDF